VTEPANLQNDAGLEVGVPAAAVESPKELLWRPRRRPDHEMENLKLLGMVCTAARGNDLEPCASHLHLQSHSLAMRAVAGDRGPARVETCGDCGTYANMFYQARNRDVNPVADDLATLGLDILACEEGWSASCTESAFED
jgi:hypothetical protein